MVTWNNLDKLASFEELAYSFSPFPCAARPTTPDKPLQIESSDCLALYKIDSWGLAPR